MIPRMKDRDHGRSGDDDAGADKEGKAYTVGERRARRSGEVRYSHVTG